MVCETSFHSACAFQKPHLTFIYICAANRARNERKKTHTHDMYFCTCLSHNESLITTLLLRTHIKNLSGASLCHRHGLAPDDPAPHWGAGIPPPHTGGGAHGHYPPNSKIRPHQIDSANEPGVHGRPHNPALQTRGRSSRLEEPLRMTGADAP